MGKLVYGVGVNDADYEVQSRIGGKMNLCRFYDTWKGMLRRCYSEKYKHRNPTYMECSVCDEWLKFSNFKSWMETQDWQGKQLDKDLIFIGNKVYSPNACAFVSHATNSFTTDRVNSRGDWPVGVQYDKRYQKFDSRCCNPFTRKNEYIGSFTCPNEAHLAWKKRKRELACLLADLQTDDRVATALRLRYA